MKRIILLSVMFTLLLCACGEKKSTEETNATENHLIPLADKYEVEWVDTSKLAPVDDVLFSVVDSELCFMQSILVSRDENGRLEHKYEEISYDMVSGEWSESQELSMTDEINRLGFAHMFRKAPDGTWYFLFPKWNEKLKRYNNTTFSRLTKDGKIEDVQIPKDFMDGKMEINSYIIRCDGKICIKVYSERETNGGLPEESKVILYDPAADKFEYGGDLLMGKYDLLSVEDEYFYYSVAGGKCGYAVKTMDTGDVVQREMYCAGETPEGGWTDDYIDFPYDTCDEENNLYMLNTGGIYGGYYKDSELKNIVPASVLDELNLSGMTNSETSIYMSDFCRGARTDYADFYALITDMEDEDHIKLTLAHIRKKE